MKISTFMIGILSVCLIIAGFWIFILDVNTNYAPSDYSDTYFQSFNKSSASMEKLSNQTRTDLQKITISDASVVDKIGAFFSAGFSTFRMIFQSFDIFSTMITTVAEAIHIPSTLFVILLMIVIIAIFVGVFLTTLMGREI